MIVTQHVHYDTARHLNSLLYLPKKDQLKNVFARLGQRFRGNPRKADMADKMADYILSHPLDVLRCLDANSLALVKELVQLPKGTPLALTGTHLFNTLQEMYLVVSREDIQADRTYLYMVDELHTAFAEVIDEAYRDPSPTLQADMLEGLEEMSQIISSSKNPEALEKRMLNEMEILQQLMDIDDEQETLLKDGPECKTQGELKTIVIRLQAHLEKLSQLKKKFEEATRLTDEYFLESDYLTDRMDEMQQMTQKALDITIVFLQMKEMVETLQRSKKKN